MIYIVTRTSGSAFLQSLLILERSTCYEYYIIVSINGNSFEQRINILLVLMIYKYLYIYLLVDRAITMTVRSPCCRVLKAAAPSLRSASWISTWRRTAPSATSSATSARRACTTRTRSSTYRSAPSFRCPAPTAARKRRSPARRYGRRRRTGEGGI